MTHDDDLDRTLQREFDTLRRIDTARAPDFTSLMAAARSTVSAEVNAAPMPNQTGQSTAAAAPTPSASGMRWLAWGAPLLVAAGLAVTVLRPSNAADQEFEQLVAEWSRTNAAQMSPTDGLLAVPGSEFLRGTPSIGTPTSGTPRTDVPGGSSRGSARTRSPS